MTERKWELLPELAVFLFDSKAYFEGDQKATKLQALGLTLSAERTEVGNRALLHSAVSRANFLLRDVCSGKAKLNPSTTQTVSRLVENLVAQVQACLAPPASSWPQRLQLMLSARLKRAKTADALDLILRQLRECLRKLVPLPAAVDLRFAATPEDDASDSADLLQLLLDSEHELSVSGLSAGDPEREKWQTLQNYIAAELGSLLVPAPKAEKGKKELDRTRSTSALTSKPAKDSKGKDKAPSLPSISESMVDLNAVAAAMPSSSQSMRITLSQGLTHTASQSKLRTSHTHTLSSELVDSMTKTIALNTSYPVFTQAQLHVQCTDEFLISEGAGGAVFLATLDVGPERNERKEKEKPEQQAKALAEYALGNRRIEVAFKKLKPHAGNREQTLQSVRARAAGSKEGASSGVDSKAARAMEREAEVLWLCRGHANIIGFLGVCYEPCGLVFEFCEQATLADKLYQIVENASAPTAPPSPSPPPAPLPADVRPLSLPTSRLSNVKPLAVSRQAQIEWSRSIILGLLFLHRQGVVHRDLKSSNILLSSQLSSSLPMVKIADFGSARLTHSESAAFSRSTGLGNFGTLRWAAPEVCVLDSSARSADTTTTGSRSRNTALDVWSLGVILSEIFLQKPPYAGFDSDAMVFQAMRERTPPHDLSPLERLSPRLRSLLASCTDRQPENRPSVPDIALLLWPAVEQELARTALMRQPSSSALNPVRILCLDGGGMRGVSTLRILQEIEKRCGDKVRNMFDLICGTSTGGIIALGLCVLNKNVEEIAEVYTQHGAEVFKAPRKKMKDLFKSGLERRTANMTALVTSLAGERTPLRDLSGKHTKAFVTAVCTDSSDPQLVLLRTYPQPPQTIASIADDDSPILAWQAARATSAAPTYFEPIRLGSPPRTLVDGGLMCNNPALLALRECEALFPGRPIELCVSIGTGQRVAAPSRWRPLQLISLVDKLVSIATNPEEAHNEVRANAGEGRRVQTYVRLNPLLGRVAMDATERHALQHIVEQTELSFSDDSFVEGMADIQRVLSGSARNTAFSFTPRISLIDIRSSVAKLADPQAESGGLRLRFGVVLLLLLLSFVFADAVSELLSVVYPLWASSRAMRSFSASSSTELRDRVLVAQWLVYWPLIALLWLMESVRLTFRGFFLVKALFALWCWLPQTQGAAVLFVRVVSPLLNRFAASPATTQQTTSSSSASPTKLPPVSIDRIRSNIAPRNSDGQLSARRLLPADRKSA